jgi:hypothetical protein
VTRLEDRLQDAFQATTQAVRPDSIRELGDVLDGARLATRRPRTRRSAMFRPLAAAAAVVAIVVAAVLTQFATRTPAGQVAAAGAPGFLVSYANLPTDSLQVVNVSTGSAVSRVRLPAVPGGALLGAVAADGGGKFVVAAVSLSQCRTWLYQFQLDRAGQPSPLKAFAPLRTVPDAVSGLTASGNGRDLAYIADSCGPSQLILSVPVYLAVANTATGRTRQWTWPQQLGDFPQNLSLTTTGRLLAFTTGQLATVRLIPADAAPGLLTDRSKIVLSAHQFGGGSVIRFAALSAGGNAIYFTVMHSIGPAAAAPEEIRAVDLATGRLSTVTKTSGIGLAVDANARDMLLATVHGSSTGLLSVSLPTGHATPLPSGWLHAYPSAAARVSW